MKRKFQFKTWNLKVKREISFYVFERNFQLKILFENPKLNLEQNNTFERDLKLNIIFGCTETKVQTKLYVFIFRFAIKVRARVSTVLWNKFSLWRRSSSSWRCERRGFALSLSLSLTHTHTLALMNQSLYSIERVIFFLTRELVNFFSCNWHLERIIALDQPCALATIKRSPFKIK